MSGNVVRVVIDVLDTEPEGGSSGGAKRIAARVLVRPHGSKRWREAMRLTTPARECKAGIWEDAIGLVVRETGELLRLCELADVLHAARNPDEKRSGE